MTPSCRRALTIIGVLTLFAAPAAGLFAHDGATGVVKQRMELMKDLGRSMKALSEIIRGRRSVSPPELTKLARDIGDHGGEAMTRLFPQHSLKNPSEARAEIWRDWQTFEVLSARLVNEAQSLAVADTAQARARAFRTIGKTCSSCHKRFRLKKKK